jgi:hypothetical protein
MRASASFQLIGFDAAGRIDRCSDHRVVEATKHSMQDPRYLAAKRYANLAAEWLKLLVRESNSFVKGQPLLQDSPGLQTQDPFEHLQPLAIEIRPPQ